MSIFFSQKFCLHNLEYCTLIAHLVHFFVVYHACHPLGCSLLRLVPIVVNIISCLYHWFTEILEVLLKHAISSNLLLRSLSYHLYVLLAFSFVLMLIFASQVGIKSELLVLFSVLVLLELWCSRSFEAWFHWC